MNVILEIRFSRSGSKKMNKADELACRLGAKQRGLKYHIEFTDAKEIFYKWELINALLNIVDKWKGFEIYYLGYLCVVNKEYRRLFYALQDMKKCYFYYNEKGGLFHCENFKFGCRFIELEYSNDKLDMQTELTLDSEINQKKLDACPAFDRQRVLDSIVNKHIRTIIMSN